MASKPAAKSISKAKAQATPALLFFTADEGALIAAIAGRLIPRDGDNPGAQEAGAMVYIDRAIAGYFSSLQVLYREGLGLIDRLARARHATGFVDLAEAQQDDILRAIESADGPEGSPRAAQFFAVILEHTIEGTFGDPIYGGNRDAIGWKMIGFPGAQTGYTAEQMMAGAALKPIPIKTLADLQATAVNTKSRG